MLPSYKKSKQHPIIAANNPPWDPKQNKAAIIECCSYLESSSIVCIMEMREYLNSVGKIAKYAGEVYIVLLENDMKAVWKPREKDYECMYAEQAAFQASLWFFDYANFHLVPPTVIKKHKDRIGSLQWYVETEPDLWITEQRELAFSKLDPSVLASAIAFLKIFGQWDTHPGNYLMQIVKDQSLLALIDNEGIINAKLTLDINERPWVCLGRALEDNPLIKEPITKSIKDPSLQEVREILIQFCITEERINNIYLWSTNNGKRAFVYILWENGVFLQPHYLNKGAFPCHAEIYPDYVLNAYESLNDSVLNKIFAVAASNCPGSFNDIFIGSIMKRAQLLIDNTPKNTEPKKNHGNKKSILSV